MELFKLGLLWFVAFIFSTTLHEAAHALAAKLLGDQTAYHGGQVTMDPIPHMQREPIGMIAAPIITFILLKGAWMMGWASAPYDPMWARRYPRRAGMMAFAGPLSNLLLVLISAGIIHLGIALDFFFPPERMMFDDIVGTHSEGFPLVLATFLSIMFSLNLLLFVFNMLPFPPLDGSAMLSLVLNRSLSLRVMELMRQPILMVIGLFAAWSILNIIFDDVHLFAINSLYPGNNYQESFF